MPEVPGTIEDRLRSYLQVHEPPGVLAAYLFGSHAEGRAHRESDVDVGVLLDWQRYASARERFDLRVELGSELIEAVGNNRVDVVILNDAPPELGRAVVTRGLRVFCNDPEADHAYVRALAPGAFLRPWCRATTLRACCRSRLSSTPMCC